MSKGQLIKLESSHLTSHRPFLTELLKKIIGWHFLGHSVVQISFPGKLTTLVLTAVSGWRQDAVWQVIPRLLSSGTESNHNDVLYQSLSGATQTTGWESTKGPLYIPNHTSATVDLFTRLGLHYHIWQIIMQLGQPQPEFSNKRQRMVEISW